VGRNDNENRLEKYGKDGPGDTHVRWPKRRRESETVVTLRELVRSRNRGEEETIGDIKRYRRKPMNAVTSGYFWKRVFLTIPRYQPKVRAHVVRQNVFCLFRICTMLWPWYTREKNGPPAFIKRFACRYETTLYFVSTRFYRRAKRFRVLRVLSSLPSRKGAATAAEEFLGV